jgi:hypothetical protein
MKTKIHTSDLRISRARLKHIRECEYGMQELIWVNDCNIAYYLRIVPRTMPEAFGGEVAYEVTFFSICCRGSNYFGDISSMMYWLNYMFGIVSVP